MKRARKVMCALVMCGACAATEPPPDEPLLENAALGIARFEVNESASQLTVNGFDEDGGLVARIDVQLGVFVMSPEWNDGKVGELVDGRRINIDVRGSKGEYQGWGYPELDQPAPPAIIAMFVHDPHVEPALARWGIHYQRPTIVAYAGCSDCNGFFGSGMGFISGTYGTQTQQNNVGSGGVVTDSNPTGCGGSFRCNVCAGGTPALHVGSIISNTDLGEMGGQTYIAQLCSTNNIGFAFKSCRQIADDPHACGTMFNTGCGCGTGACVGCTSYQDAFTSPYGAMNFDHNFVQWGYSTSCFPTHTFCTDDASCCHGHCNIQHSGGAESIPSGYCD